jgi:hypothetical protein
VKAWDGIYSRDRVSDGGLLVQEGLDSWQMTTGGKSLHMISTLLDLKTGRCIYDDTTRPAIRYVA